MPKKPIALHVILSKNNKIAQDFIIEQCKAFTERRFQNALFIGTETKSQGFLEKLSSKEIEYSADIVVEEYIDKEQNKSLFCFPKTSLLFMDFSDKTVWRSPNEKTLDINSLDIMLRLLKERYNPSMVFIDKLENISCTYMGREKLWRTNPGNKYNYEDWRQRKMEYIISLLYFLAKKHEVSFMFSMELDNSFEEYPEKDNIKYLFGFGKEMIDKFSYLNETELDKMEIVDIE